MSPRPVKVLLVEDSPSDAELLQEALRGTGAGRFEFVVAERLAEALHQVKHAPFDVLLLDLSLPDSTGADTFFRARAAAPGLPIIVLTGTENEVVGTEAVRHGIQDYLLKGEADGRQIARTIRYAIERKRVEEALRESEARFRAVFNATQDAVMLADDEGNCVDANPAAARLFGLPAANLIGARIDQFMGQGFDFAEVWAKFMQQGRFQGERQFGRAEGTAVTVDWEGIASILPGRHLVVSRDITKRKRAEEDLRQAHEQLEVKVEQRTADLRRANQMLRVISECNQALFRATNELELTQNICRIIGEVGGYRMVWVGLAEDDKPRTVRPVASVGAEDGYLDSIRIVWANTPHGRGPTGRCIRNGKPCVGHDFLTDPELAPWREQALERGYRSSVALPLKADGRTFGALTLYAPQPAAFDSLQISLLKDLADDLAFGIVALRAKAERDRAQRSLEQKAAQLRALTAELFQTEERERRRIAQVLHDHFQQLLVGARYGLGALRGESEAESFAKAVQRIDDLLGKCLDTSRSLTLQLSPPILYEAGLVAALRWLGEWFQGTHGLSVKVTARARRVADSEELRIALFQSVRELLFNVVKHAQVKEAQVELRQERDKELRIVVRDAGVGFNPAQLSAPAGPAGGFGLFSLRERIEFLGGRLEVESSLGAGSRFTLWVPLRQKPDFPR
jgi:PAS domain S-box-containing protein